MSDEENKTEENKTAEAEKAKVAAVEEQKKQRNAKRRKPRGERKPTSQLDSEVDMEERIVAVNRVAKVVKGGRRFSFSALVVRGDKKGRVGYGLGKAKEVPEAIRKAVMTAASNMIYVPIERGTIPHEILGEFDAGKIMFRPAAEGTGIKAAGACRSILELAGIKDVLTKSLRGNNPHNVVKATFEALKALRSSEEIAKLRGFDKKRIRLK